MTHPTLVPELYVTNLQQSLSFYIGLLNFQIEYTRPESGFAAISLEGGHLMLEEFSKTMAATVSDFEEGHWRTGEFTYPLGRGVNFEFTVSNVESIAARLSNNGYDLRLGLRERWYRVDKHEVGVKQFLVMDPDGYLIRLSESIRTR